MKITKQLQKEFSKMNSVKVSLMVGTDEDLFAELMDCMLSTDKELSRRAAWAMSFCYREHPFLFDKYVGKFVELMNSKIYHDAVLRTITQSLENMDIPEEYEGMAYEYGMEILLDPHAPIAVKAYSIQILQNIARKFPELKQELIQVVQDRMEFETPAFRSRGKRMLKEFNMNNMNN
jgi:hypothetical protein